MISTDQIDDIMNKELRGPGGDKIGDVHQVYLDDQTGRPEWATVSTGMLSKKENFVPLAQAELSGDAVTVPFDKDKIKGAPECDVDGGHLSQTEEADLYRYYGMDYDETDTRSGLPYGQADTGGVRDDDELASRRDVDAIDERDDARETKGQDTSGPSTDDAITRSEEQLKVGTESRVAGTARLRKYVVTENVTTTVPVSHEEVRVEREPITDTNRDQAGSGPDISEEEHEVTLHEERPVVDKETVPVERVRLDTETVTEQEQVSDEVRKEQIDTETDTGRDTDDRLGDDRR